jgi:mannose-6-phosphate isomerase-like protein (cupin superfamily)
MVSRSYRTESVKENIHKVDVRQLYNDASAQIMHITLKPGESLKPHKTPVKVVFYILEGKPTIHVGNDSMVFENDILVESPADIVHFISNNSTVTARIMVIKAPRPEKPAIIL